MRVGIDVGGTNTDAVLMDGTKVIAAVKTLTTEDVTSGIVAALRELESHARLADVRAVMIGTTHFINALVEANRLAPTAALRFGLPATAALPPMVDWPESLVRAVRGRSYLCHGGFEYDGQTISDLDEAEIRAAVADMREHGVRGVADSSVFSPVSAEHELRAAEIIAAEAPELVVSLSHEIGRLGMLQRENATIINAALGEMAVQIVDGLAAAVRGAGIHAPLYLSQNDGTLMEIEYARRYPVATFASGPTNSMRGAAFLSGLSDCVVVDVGGTTTDVGVLQRGFPREAATEVVVAGVRTNFRMPDVVSIGLGGGSLVRGDQVGPDSVGYRLTERALVFGGDVLTATDIGVAAGTLDIGDRDRVRHLPDEFVRDALAAIEAKISEVIDRMRTSHELPPIVVVGGGGFLVPDDLAGVGAVHRTEHFAVANAIGAAIAQVGGEVDRIYPLQPGRRDAVLDEAKQEAVDRAVAGGADPNRVEIVDVDEVPIAYLPGNATRIRVKAVGDLMMAGPV
jgi:N-methylhydantoinase A/oxoprolinase/acetone carboxylase beta subunit